MDERSERRWSSADTDLDRELEAALGDMEIDSLMEADEPAPSAVPAAGVRRGRVIAIQKDDIFVDMGGKSQGLLAASQFDDAPLPRVGEVIEVTITGYDSAEGLLVLSRKGAVMATTWQALREGAIVEGRVTGHNKGGLELVIDGIKAFMPISQVERGRVEELAPYVNRRLRCRVTDVRRDEKTVVVSRRDVLDMEAAAEAARTFETLQEGQVVRGTVKTLMPYGAFVDIGGLDGLLHVRDMAFSRVEKPEDVVKVGQQLDVKVLRVDREARKIALGLKQVMPDPWDTVPAKYPPDSLVTGRVTRLEGFGAFVEIEPGVEGLVPISEMTFERRIKHPSEVIKVGDVTQVRVISIDMERRRISLSVKRVGDDPWQGASVRWPEGAIVKGVVRRLSEFGAFVELATGVEGLVHISELSNAHVRQVSEVVREGQEVTVKVLEVDEDRRRIGLSIRKVAESPDYTGSVDDESAPAAPRLEKKRKKPLKGGLEW